MTKISKSFRLSEQAQEYLRQLGSQTGSSETAIVEMALARFAKFMQGDIDNAKEVTNLPVVSPALLPERAKLALPSQKTQFDEFEPFVPEPEYPPDFDDQVTGLRVAVKSPPAPVNNSQSRKRHKRR
jgi:hypothetical protein